jgi:hypothetical protein
MYGVFTYPRSEMKKAVIIVGPTKAGSSWVWAALKRLGCSLPCHEKEVFFFDHNFDKGAEWFLGQYPSVDLVYFDVAPTLFRKVDEAAPRIKKVFDVCLIIILARDPVERAISDYQHFRKTGRCKQGLREAIENFPEILEQSRYSKYTPLWEKHFPVEIIDFDGIRNTPERIMKRLCGLADRDSDWTVPPGPVNETKAMPSPLYGYLRTQVSLIMTKRLMWRLKFVLRMIDRGILRILSPLSKRRSADLTVTEDEIEWVTAKLRKEIKWYQNTRENNND